MTQPQVPSSRVLLRSTIAAIAVAALILVCIVLPAEYGLDPTRFGSMIGLTEMGRIKVQLAKEAAAQEASGINSASSALVAQDSSAQNDSLTVTLEPGSNIEVKLAMTKGQRAEYSWSADSGVVYYDLHGHTLKIPRTAPHRYGEGTLRAAQGEIVAEFDGVHGWYWENRTEKTTTIFIRAWGQFKALIEM